MSRPEIEREERFGDLVRELRGHQPEPSAELRGRIEQIAAATAEPGRPERRSVITAVAFPRRRLLLAAAAVVVLAALAGGIVLGSRGGGSPTAHRSAGDLQTSGQALQTKRAASTFGAATVPGTARVPQPSNKSASGAESQPASPLTGAKRLAELHAELTLRVASQRALADATGRAERIARGSGGYVASANYDSGSESGSSFLKLKVPAQRAQGVLARLGRLGELLSQNVSLEDLQATVNGQTDAIRALQTEISALVRSLQDPSLTAEARSRLQAQLALKRAQLKSTVLARRATKARGVYATISLTLTTAPAPAAVQPGTIHRAFDDARHGLATEIAWLVRASVVAAPLIVLALLLLLGTRQRRRRLEQRLLARS